MEELNAAKRTRGEDDKDEASKQPAAGGENEGKRAKKSPSKPLVAPNHPVVLKALEKGKYIWRMGEDSEDNVPNFYDVREDGGYWDGLIEEWAFDGSNPLDSDDNGYGNGDAQDEEVFIDSDDETDLYLERTYLSGANSGHSAAVYRPTEEEQLALADRMHAAFDAASKVPSMIYKPSFL